MHKGYSITTSTGDAAAIAYARTTRVSKPKMVTRGNRRFIQHKEFLSNVYGSSVYYTTTASYAGNPGLVTSLPWLSTQAQAYEKYEFKRFSVTSLPRCPTTTAGSLIIAPDYDASDTAPLTEQVHCSYAGCVEDAPWKVITCDLDPRMLKGERFVRTGAVPPNADIKLYDAFNIYFGTVDGASAAPWSKVWVSYEIELINPQLVPVGPPINAGTIYGSSSLGANTTNIFNGINAITGNYSVTFPSNNNIAISNLIPGNEYYISCSIAGTTVTQVYLSGVSGVTLKTQLAPDNCTTTNGIFAQTFVPTATTGSFTIGLSAATIVNYNIVFCSLTPSPIFTPAPYLGQPKEIIEHDNKFGAVNFTPSASCSLTSTPSFDDHHCDGVTFNGYIPQHTPGLRSGPFTQYVKIPPVPRQA